MQERIIKVERKTRETEISAVLNLSRRGESKLQTEIPFLNHLLFSLAFHGGFSLTLKAEGDLEVDPHHQVEDTGLVIGEAISRIVPTYGAIARFGHSVVPMDESLSEAVVDLSGRPHLVFKAEFPQDLCGTLPIHLLQDFFQALANRSLGTYHLLCRYGENSHHMAESLFKALGKALSQAWAPQKNGEEPPSTKGVI